MPCAVVTAAPWAESGRRGGWSLVCASGQWLWFYGGLRILMRAAAPPQGSDVFVATIRRFRREDFGRVGAQRARSAQCGVRAVRASRNFSSGQVRACQHACIASLPPPSHPIIVCMPWRPCVVSEMSGQKPREGNIQKESELRRLRSKPSREERGEMRGGPPPPTLVLSPLLSSLSRLGRGGRGQDAAEKEMRGHSDMDGVCGELRVAVWAAWM